MGRLEQTRKKQLNNTIYFSLFILILVVIFILTVGIKILLNTSSFVARISEKKTNTTLKKNQNLIEDVDIDSIPVATNSSRIFVGGTVVNFDQVEFYLNGDLVKESSLLSSDGFIEEIGDLVKGQNEVFVIGKLKDSDEEKKSKIFTVFYKSDKPKLDIKEPQDNSKTSNLEIKIMGETDKETYIKVNDLPVVVDAQGVFQTMVKLKEGENKIAIIAQDVAGNSEEKILILTYEKD
ncbi:hypothetical protein A2954_01475 [Candidatus Roizmanbacteria bacterium RIFCSPLOWO2_01_FULL_37_12]|uniref:Bacterial Ig domain-containing protein n=1 Tax=Candidatus Roizmanbacteria bacterium RIFCSPLOWO2_01_FULL_37_12 TaxID=1802056 RepID=A0A1F7I8Z5_9BACT|nr:MAG: hypothetical protein A2768_00940 [Candidatus Roizmanbacteria bacterium RIFCSPHIGHO2_01_FULL_37_16]OGK26619.1 MAG: hypothetical protein A3D76_01940 [Candidatus Roizmanbacteria bacterium RIFCSPHIGHO2_02_FULL_37_9b]OGK39819.1 MAG: hypothetical protein A2954_01475 [Candidatus Roizmanbacteria bacterium RIFCSPLOWO2_01_FULL_37_12]